MRFPDGPDGESAGLPRVPWYSVGRLIVSAAAVVTFCCVAVAGPAAADPAAPATPTSPVTPSPAPSTTLMTAIDRDGTFAVGTELLPGVYASAGPAEGTTCYWRRVGADNVTLNNALSSQPQVVEVEATDIAFKTNGCQPWQLTEGAVPAGQMPPWLAQLQLRHDLNVLNGLAGQSGNGQLPPY